MRRAGPNGNDFRVGLIEFFFTIPTCISPILFSLHYLRFIMHYLWELSKYIDINLRGNKNTIFDVTPYTYSIFTKQR